MNTKTLKALNGSIEKWNNIINNKGEDRGTGNCPLCKEFYEKSCKGCPVAKKAGETCCVGTPYMKFYDHYERLHNEYPRKTSCRYCKTIAKKELAFLKSLKPKRPKK